MDIIAPYVNLEVVAFCLLFGNVLKNNLGFISKYIPLILGVVGVLLNIGFNNDITFTIGFSGFISGLFSTSIHQVYKIGNAKEDK